MLSGLNTNCEWLMKIGKNLFLLFILFQSCVGYYPLKILNCNYESLTLSGDQIAIEIQGGYYNSIHYTVMKLKIDNNGNDTIRFNYKEFKLGSKNYNFSRENKDTLISIYPSDQNKMEIFFWGNNKNSINKPELSGQDTLIFELAKFETDNSIKKFDNVKFIYDIDND